VEIQSVLEGELSEYKQGGESLSDGLIKSEKLLAITLQE